MWFETDSGVFVNTDSGVVVAPGSTRIKPSTPNIFAGTMRFNLSNDDYDSFADRIREEIRMDEQLFEMRKESFRKIKEDKNVV